ncbi:molybdopterin-dependent oxidoreductase [Flammeovirga yaeyamensis]|uniref:Molybdopterin-dependent oxidoreductase n=1 Tax=Flammeovirga yaeyamensis TaxID=367791 RepID=A0AAX1N787_9BACT|nr:molybdopterin-dependent oxidoreductase [Flammeovirga yaeyamensis]MBB3698023.1 nitrate reductase NapA [Flammeovirga yaeyamensis]QWG03418.1 molybdopterin-dependent oxidoreductase [Flammeovirga yaeyamensis]
MSNKKDDLSLSRRDFLKLTGGTVAVGGAALSGWGLTELIVDEGPVKSWHKSVCRYCGTGCGVMLGMNKDKLVRVRGDQEAHNKGVICIKGSMLDKVMKSPERLKVPKIKKNGKLVESTWEEAMELMTKKFKENLDQNGPTSIGFYGSGQLLIEESYTANKLFKAGFKSNNVDGNPRLCMASAAVGYTQTFGKDEPPGAYEDIDHAETFFLIGSNAYECHPPLWERIMLRKKADPNVKIIVVDPRKTKTAVHADVYVPVLPGKDMLLLNSMCCVIAELGLIDEDFVGKYVNFSDGKNKITLDEYKKFLKDYRPEKVADELGITPRQIREIAYQFASSKATMSLWTMGINQRVQGVFLNNTLNSLHLITGQICKPGATPLSLTGQSNACGGVRDTGSLAHLLPNGRLIAKEQHRNEMEELWKVPKGTIAPKPGRHALAMFDGMVTGDVKAALIMCSNPAQSLPNNRYYREGMEKAFLVVSEIFEDTETAKFADILLPAALYIEKEGVYGQTERRYQIIEKLREPVGQARSDFDILVDFANRMGQGKLITYKTPTECWDEYRIISKSSKYDFSGITRERLRTERGIQWPCPSEDHPGTVRRYIKGDPFADKHVDANHKVHFYGKPDGKAVVFARPYIAGKEDVSEERPLFLTTGRVISQWHTGTMTFRVPELNHSAGPGRFVFHPSDAGAQGVKKGDKIEVESSRGKMEGIVDISRDHETPGVVFAAFYDQKFLVNNVVSDDHDPVSKEPDYKVTAISVKKLS